MDANERVGDYVNSEVGLMTLKDYLQVFRRVEGRSLSRQLFVYLSDTKDDNMQAKSDQ